MRDYYPCPKKTFAQREKANLHTKLEPISAPSLLHIHQISVPCILLVCICGDPQMEQYNYSTRHFFFSDISRIQLCCKPFMDNSHT